MDRHARRSYEEELTGKNCDRYSVNAVYVGGGPLLRLREGTGRPKEKMQRVISDNTKRASVRPMFQLRPIWQTHTEDILVQEEKVRNRIK